MVCLSTPLAALVSQISQSNMLIYIVIVFKLIGNVIMKIILRSFLEDSAFVGVKSIALCRHSNLLNSNMQKDTVKDTDTDSSITGILKTQTP